jgi:hypothetical protein
MRAIVKSNDPVLLNHVESLLRQAGLTPFLADSYMSAMEGSIAMLPRRILVASEQWAEARTVLVDAGLGEWVLRDEPE